MKNSALSIFTKEVRMVQLRSWEEGNMPGQQSEDFPITLEGQFEMFIAPREINDDNEEIELQRYAARCRASILDGED